MLLICDFIAEQSTFNLKVATAFTFQVLIYLLFEYLLK